MRHAWLLGLALLALFSFGCGDRKNFKPPRSKIVRQLTFHEQLKAPIIFTNRYGAILSNGGVLDRQGLTQLKIEKKEDKETSFLNQSQDYYILAHDCWRAHKRNGPKVKHKKHTTLTDKQAQEAIIDNIEETDQNVQLHDHCHKLELISTALSAAPSITIPLDTYPLSASIKGNQLAVVMADNSANIYDIKTKKLLFNEKGSSSPAINSLVAAPVFLDTVVVFPMLDGRLLVVDVASKEPRVVRNIVLNSEKFFNNVIYLKVDDENMFAATGKRLVSVISGQEFNFDADIVDVLYKHHRLYVLTLDGRILEMDQTLNDQSMGVVKLPFAMLNTIVVTDKKLYTLEKRGYLVEVDLEHFDDYRIYPLKSASKSFMGNLDRPSFYTDDKIYYDRYFFDLSHNHP
ncbi:hypothetical protein NHP21005_04310 [Helicobacter sp. NHP21005]|uniref:hypothetical protein n=1 Tax=Helicobacter felistomachi TaxID=3040201 RepID=UPI002573BACD|nr:hypothetical protein [Helicobacter sp. NHP21005]BEG56743.1 hypothetical protein NHP21005_04310 [Helicobacter sp. NHP21005]